MRWSNISRFFFVIFIILVIRFHRVQEVNGANILGIFTSHAPSHFIVHMSVVKALAEAGHNVTVVSTQKPKVTHSTINHIIIPLTALQEQRLNAGLDGMAANRKNLFAMIRNVFSFMNSKTAIQFEVLQNPQFIQLYESKFDLIILGYFMNDFQFGVAAKFNCPIILSWTGAPAGFINEFVGNPAEISYVPVFNVAVKNGEPLNFMKRVQNFMIYGLLKGFHMFINYQMSQYYSNLFSDEINFPSLDYMKKNISLVFCNSHFSEGPIRSNVPAIVEIGGIQVKGKPAPLPKDIASLLEKSNSHGAILFCLGSNLKASNVNRNVVEIIFSTLSSLKQNVIWKWDDLENSPGKSENILYSKWIPQDDILAHPNLKLFITHAGKGGIAEAQYHGVPMVALPFLAEQPGNADKMVIDGYGIRLNILTMTANEFKEAILEVLENPKYRENVENFSSLYRDRPLKAKENVVFWTEYILRHHGASHLQSPLKNLNFIQSSSLDVISFLLLLTYIVLKVIKMIVIFIWRKCLAKKNRVESNETVEKNKSKVNQKRDNKKKR